MSWLAKKSFKGEDIVRCTVGENSIHTAQNNITSIFTQSWWKLVKMRNLWVAHFAQVSLQYVEPKLTRPPIFIEYFIKYQWMKGVIMFLLQIGVLKRRVCLATPTHLPRPPPMKNTKIRYFLLILKLYFAHFCIAMNVPTSHGDTKMCKIMLKNE